MNETSELKISSLREKAAELWNDISEEIPPDGTLCFVYAPGFDDKGIHLINFAVFREGNWSNALSDAVVGFEPTHWMVVPKPPPGFEVLVKLGAHQYPVDVDPNSPPDEVIIRGRDKVVKYCIDHGGKKDE